MLAPMDARFEPLDVTVKRDEGITIVFADDHVATFSLVDVRLGCPCADCQVARGKGQPGWPLPHSPIPLAITDAEFHGGWGLGITWNDGHSTGIFSFQLLREWSEEGPSTR